MPQSTLERDSALTADVRTYFERAAGSFDHLYNEDGQTPWMRWVNRQFRSDIVGRYLLTAEHVSRSGANSVLDVGCGSGRYLAEFARLGVKRLVGIDLSQPMLDLAFDQISRVGHSNTDLVCANFDDFTTDERFDVVVAMGFFDYIADPVAVLSQMRSLAKHSVIASFPSRHWLRTPVRQIRYRIKKCPVFFYDHTEIADVASQAGFAYIETSKLPGAGMDYVTTLLIDTPSRAVLNRRPAPAVVHRAVIRAADVV